MPNICVFCGNSKTEDGKCRRGDPCPDYKYWLARREQIIAARADIRNTHAPLHGGTLPYRRFLELGYELCELNDFLAKLTEGPR